MHRYPGESISAFLTGESNKSGLIAFGNYIGIRIIIHPPNDPDYDD
jgi:hypothetical protein